MVFAESFLDRIEARIGQLESRTSAEFVVAMAPKSGSYADARMLVGILAAAAFLAVALYSPLIFHGWFVLPEAFVIGLLFFWASGRTPGVFRLLTQKRRRRRQVLTAARAAFVEIEVSAALERNGILFYISHLEDEVLIIPDLGIDGRVPEAEWNVIMRRLGGPRSNPDFQDCFLRELECAGEILAQAFPPCDENPNEIPDRPRMLT